MRLISILTFAVISYCQPVLANESYELTISDMERLEMGVREDLVDPESARFYEIEAVKSTDGLLSVCGYVNAKNSFGGYVGKRAFFGSFRGDNFELRSLAQDSDTSVQVKNRCNMYGIW